MKKLRVAILGQGRSGRDIHACYLRTDPRRFVVVAAVDPLKARRDRARQELGCEVYGDHRPLLKRQDLDLVINAAPSHLHVPISLEFLRAGHNVLCDKPLASRVKDVDALIAASKKSKTLLAIFQQSRFAPYFRQAQKIIASGVLGDVVQVSIAYNGFNRRYDWQTLREFMGGNLLNTGPHPLDLALQFFGGDGIPQVHCVMRNATSYGDAEDHVTLLLHGSGRPIIHLEISSCCAYPTFNLHVYASRGGLKGTLAELEWRYYDAKTAPKKRLMRAPLCKPDGTPSYCTDSLTWHERRWSLPKSQRDQFFFMSKSFYTMLYAALTTGAPLEITPEQVRRQVAVIEECRRQNPEIWG